MIPPFTLPVKAILLIGPTGVGKSPLGEVIARSGFLGMTVHHLDFGAELRTIAAGSSLGGAFSAEEISFLQGVLNRGLLLENERFSLANRIIRAFLERYRHANNDLLVLNGIPRHIGQAADIAAVADIGAIVSLECSDYDVFLRIEKNAGGDRYGRTDDEKHKIEKKLEIFRERTAPLIEHYTRLGATVYRLCIRSTMTAEESYHNLSALAAVNPPVSLVVEPPER